MEKVIYAIFILLLVSPIHLGYAETTEETKQSATSPKKSEAEEPSKDKEDTSPLTGTFDITSNYLFRGVSQSNNTPAFQGGFAYAFKKTGIHLNVWGSNVYMPVPDSTNTATVEIDTSAGIANSINDNTNYDIYFLRYFYPKATALQYNELIGSLTFHFLTGLIGYSNNVFNSGSSGTYYNLAVNFDIPSRYVYFEDVSINGAVGYYSLPKAAGNSYKDYAIALKKDIKNYSLAVQWTNTDHKLLNNSLDHSHVIGTVTASF